MGDYERIPEDMLNKVLQEAARLHSEKVAKENQGPKGYSFSELEEICSESGIPSDTLREAIKNTMNSVQSDLTLDLGGDRRKKKRAGFPRLHYPSLLGLIEAKLRYGAISPKRLQAKRFRIVYMYY